jgi:hypothetical protein
MRECVTEEVLQQYFDGELPGERMESTALHLAGCEACTASLRELEEETNFLCSALAPEFDVTVPTERLHRRINAAIAGLHVVKPVESEVVSRGWRKWVEPLAAFAGFSPQRTFAYTGLVAVLVFAAILGVSRLRSSPVAPVQQANNTPRNPITSAPQKSIDKPAGPVEQVADVQSSSPTSPPPVKRKRSYAPVPRPVTPVNAVVDVKLIPGERSYLKTIAALDTTIKSSSRTMKPSLQAEYERNLALVDRAIAATRTAAKRNPNDPDAADFMFAAYQSKVDLLSTIADARVYNHPR